MTLAVKYFNSSLPGAPVLTGQVGSLINVLDAVLVNGFNSKTVTSITLSGSTATATVTGHGYTVGSPTPITLLFAGADQSAYNGDQVVTVVDANTLTFQVSGTPTTPATTSTSITCKVSPLGWTKPQSGTNTASYKLPAGSTGLYLGVDDNQASGAQYSARVRGFETMSAAGVAVASGTGPFPADTQVSGGDWLHKSITQDSTARPWRIVGDANGFYLHVLSNSSVGELYWFGDPISLKSGDNYGCAICCTATANTGNQANMAFGTLINNAGAATAGSYAARSFTQLGSSVTLGLLGDTGVSTGNTFGGGGFAYPNGPDNGLHVSKVRMVESAASANRFVLPGLYQPLHSKPGSDGDLVPNPTNLSSATLMLMSGGNSGNSDTYRYAIDIVGPWR